MVKFDLNLLGILQTRENEKHKKQERNIPNNHKPQYLINLYYPEICDGADD